MKFYLHYLPAAELDANGNVLREAGTIVSYQEGGGDHNKCPDDCEELIFAEVVPGVLDYTQMKMKVDVATKQLVYINPAKIPQPINT